MLQKFLPSNASSSIVLLVRIESICIYVFQKGELIHYEKGLYDDDNLNSIEQLCKKHSSLDIIVLLDNPNQTFTIHKIPSLSKKDAVRIAKRKFNSEMKDYNICHMILLSKSSVKITEWSYLFFGLSKDESVDRWLQFIDKLPNHLRCYAFSPIEIVHINSNLKTQINYKWRVYLLEHDSQSFRINLLEGDDIILTRFMPKFDLQNIDTIVDHLIYEINNTIEYALRVNSDATDRISVILLVDKVFYKPFNREKNNIHAPQILIIDIYDILKNILPTKTLDTFSDNIGSLLLPAFMASKNSIVPVYTNYMKSVIGLRIFKNTMQLFTVILIVILSIGIGMDSYNIHDTNHQIVNIKKAIDNEKLEIDKLEQNFVMQKKTYEEKYMLDSRFILDYTGFVKEIDSNKKLKFNKISQDIQQILPKDVKIIELSLDQYNKDRDTMRSVEIEYSIFIRVMIITVGVDYDKLLSVYQELTKNLNKKYKEEYEIYISPFSENFQADTKIFLNINLKPKVKNSKTK